MSEPTAGYLDGREHLLPVRVYYEDTDFTGVVYHANYLRYFERGRSDFLRLAGVSHTELRQRPTDEHADGNARRESRVNPCDASRPEGLATQTDGMFVIRACDVNGLVSR